MFWQRKQREKRELRMCGGRVLKMMGAATTNDKKPNALIARMRTDSKLLLRGIAPASTSDFSHSYTLLRGVVRHLSHSCTLLKHFDGF